MDINTANRFLYDQVPIRVQRLFPQKLKLAYAAADELIKSSPMMQTPAAMVNRGRIISMAVDFGVKGMIESGEWGGADFSWQPYADPTGLYLEVRMPHSTLSISQVKVWNDQPRSVAFRENARLGNTQLNLPGMDGEDEDEAWKGVPSFLLVHGHKDLQFAHIGIPHRYHSHGYLLQTPNLLGLLHEAPAPDTVPPEPPSDIDALLSLKAEIEKWQRDNGG